MEEMEEMEEISRSYVMVMYPVDFCKKVCMRYVLYEGFILHSHYDKATCLENII